MATSSSASTTLPVLPPGARVVSAHGTTPAPTETFSRASTSLVDLRVTRLLPMSTQRAQQRLTCLKQLFVTPRATIKAAHSRAMQNVVGHLRQTKSVRNVRRVERVERVEPKAGDSAPAPMCLPFFSCTSLALPEEAGHCASGLTAASALVATGSVDGVITVWDAQSCRPLCSASTCVNRGWGRVRSLASHPTAPVCFSTTMFDHRIRAWKLQTNGSVSAEGNGEAGGGDGCALAMAASSRAVDAQGTATEHVARVNKLSVDPTGTLLASASDDATVRLWDIRRLDDASPQSLSLTARNLHKQQQQSAIEASDSAGLDLPLLLTHDGYSEAGAVTSVAFHPDGSLVSTTDAGGRVVTWDTRTGQLAFCTAGTLRGGHLGRATCVAWSPCGVRLASAGADHVMQMWDARMVYKSTWADATTGNSESRKAAAAGCAPYMMLGHDDVITSLSFYTDLPSSGGGGAGASSGAPSWRSVMPLALVSTSLDRTVRLWDADTGLCAHTLRADYPVYDHCRLRLPAGAGTEAGAESLAAPSSVSRSSPAAIVTVGHSKHWSVWDVVQDADTFQAYLAETEEEVTGESTAHRKRPRAENEEGNDDEDNDEDDSDEDEMAALRKPTAATGAKSEQVDDDEDSDDDEMAALLRK